MSANSLLNRRVAGALMCQLGRIAGVFSLATSQSGWLGTALLNAQPGPLYMIEAGQYTHLARASYPRRGTGATFLIRVRRIV
jgi:hypothetical protein